MAAHPPEVADELAQLRAALAASRADADRARAGEASARADAATARAGEASARAEAEKAVARARQLQRRGRLTALLSAGEVDIPQVFTSATLRGSSTKKLDGFSKSLPVAALPVPPLDDEEAISVSALSMMETVTPPAGKAKEIKDYHPHMKTLLQSIAAAAREVAASAGDHHPERTMLRPFHESRAVDGTDAKHPDFSFTAAHEQQRGHANTCMVMEVKPKSREGKEQAAVARQAVAGCIRYLAQRQEACNDLLTRGIACAVVGAVNLLVVYINFSDDAMPVCVTDPLDLTTLEGLRILVRLLCARDSLTVFGLSPVVFQVSELDAPQFAHLPPTLLGSGGFSNVVQLTQAISGMRVACKFARIDAASGGAALDWERYVLEQLNGDGNAVPFVPRVVQHELLLDTTGKRGLLLTPVGRPLWSEASDDLEERRAIAVLVLSSLCAALTAASSCGYLHGDVRPSNVILVDEDDGSKSACLIDWGLAVQTGASQESMFGELAFFSDNKLQVTPGSPWTSTLSDDLDAAVFTFLAILASKHCSAPWPCHFWQTPKDVIQERAEWIVEHDSEALGALRACDDERARSAVLQVVERARDRVSPTAQAAARSSSVDSANRGPAAGMM